MLLKVIKNHNIAPAAMSIMVGDKLTDMTAASKANIRRRYLITEDNPSVSSNYVTVCSLKEIEQLL